MNETIVHRAPTNLSGLTPCCGQLLFDLESSEQVTNDPSLVTCQPRTRGEAEVRFDRLADNKGRWETPDPMSGVEAASDQEVAETLRQMAVEVEKLKVPTMRCIRGEFMLWLPHARAVLPGHIYSEAGVREARISQCCEYHFDKMFDEDWTDPLTGEPGDMHPDRAAWVRNEKMYEQAALPDPSERA